jgi:hypothetical protein
LCQILGLEEAVPQVVIENPFLNSPFEEPQRHFRFSDEGITNEVVCYVKNHNLGFNIPYTLEGDERNYIPDFIVRVTDGHGSDDLLNLVLEVSGEPRKDKAAKVATARNLWVPAINNHGGFGRWAFLEIADPWDAQNTIRAFLRGEQPLDRLGIPR